MPTSTTTTRSATPMVLAALLMATSLAPAVQAQDTMSRDEFEATLTTMQEQVDAAVEAYADGDRAAALEDARTVRDRFGFNGSGASDLERKIKDVSAVAIGDQVKANSARLVTALERNASVEEVEGIGEDLAPSLNRLVLVAQGEATPASQRSLKSTEAIDAAAEDVLDQVNGSVDLYADGDAEEAQAMAEEAFFTFETNGLGPDTSTVDDDLENRAENLIVNFDASTAEDDPGLSQLIERGASLEDVRAQRDRIVDAVAQVRELLEATLPPLDLGDANGDGKVTIVDALLVAQAALGIRSESANMDANQDGGVTIVDALLVAQAALGVRDL